MSNCHSFQLLLRVAVYQLEFPILFHIIYRQQSIFDSLKQQMNPYKIHSPLSSTATNTPQLQVCSAYLKSSLKNISRKYSSTETCQAIRIINLAIKDRKCRLKQILKDLQYDKEEETFQNYYPLKQTQSKLPEMMEYYKYYTQTSILYQVHFFKLMHAYRERKKEVEYDRLKIILNLSSSAQNIQNHLQKNLKYSYSTSSFNIMSKLHLTNTHGEESEVLARLNHRLQQDLGPNRFKTIEELDQNYNFKKRRTDGHPFDLIRLKKLNSPFHDKQNGNFNQKFTKREHRKRNSCEVEVQNVKKGYQRQRSVHKKKHLSMDNLSTLMRDYNIKEKKLKTSENFNSKIVSVKNSNYAKLPQKPSQQKVFFNQFDRGHDIKSKILEVKKRIKNEKLQLKKKLTETTNQSETLKSTKKITMLHYSASESIQKHKNRKLFKPTFF